MYTAYARSLLEYSDTVLENYANQCKKQLEALNTEATRIITGANKLCSIDKLLTDLGWETFQERRTKHKLVTFFKQ